MSTVLDRDAEMLETFRIMDELANGTMERKFNDIIDFMQELYLKEDKEWLIMYSGGKDSTLVLMLAFYMLERLPILMRHKKIHVISADTKVETQKMTAYLKKNLEFIQSKEKEYNLQVHLVQPDMKNSFFWNVIGRGVVPPKPPSPFQWCTKKMKVNPMNEKMEEILSQAPIDFEIEKTPYDALMLLGSRLDESAKRAKSINKFTFSDEDVFAQHADYSNVRVCYPIKFVKTSDLWAYITSKPNLPWGLDSMELFEMYADGSGECPMTRDELEKAKGCGSSSSRNGCWVCLYAGREDKMLNALIATGHSEVNYQAAWKSFLYDVVYDVRYREPLRRREVQESEKRKKNPQIDTSDLFDLFLDEQEKYYKNYLRADKTAYEPGGFTFELRLILLQKLLYTQEMVGYELIEPVELQAILDNWKIEGYTFGSSDIVAINHQYDGSLILKPDGSINEKDTKNPNPKFEISFEFKLNKFELMDYIKERQKITGRSIYCYFDHMDYEKEGIVYNYLRFIVCHPSIQTKLEATEHIINWLYVEGPNAKELDMTPDAFEAARNLLMLSAIGEAVESNRERSPQATKLLKQIAGLQ